MAITSGDTYIASAKQVIPYTKTASVTTIANTRFTTFGVAGNPGAGTRAMTTATTGAVPDDTVAGYPLLNAFGGSATGYLSRVQLLRRSLAVLRFGTSCSASTLLR